MSEVYLEDFFKEKVFDGMLRTTEDTSPRLVCGQIHIEKDWVRVTNAVKLNFFTGNWDACERMLIHASKISEISTREEIRCK